MADEQTGAPTGVQDTGTGLRFTPPPEANTGLTLEEQAAALDLANGGTPSEDTGPKLPEGYTDWETYGKDLASGKVKAPAAEEPAKEEPAKEPTGEETPEVKAEREAFEAKQAPYTKEVTETGTLSDESVAKAAKDFGVTEDMVRQYLAGQQATGAAANAPFIETVGGDWDKFNAWASKELSAQDQTALNKALAGDPDAALLALKPFAERFKGDGAANPPTTLTRHGGGQPGTGEGYASMEQQLAAQQDPRYASDPAYRKEVETRISKSTAY